MASREERRRMKKKRKKLEKGGTLNQATDYFDIYGPDARAELQLQTETHFKAGQTAISVKDAQLLLQWASSPVGTTMQPGWAFVRNKPLCQKVVVVALGGVDAKGWAEHHTRYPRLCELIPPNQRVTIKLPKYSKTAAMGPESLLELHKIMPSDKRARTENLPASAAPNCKLDPQKLLLSSSDLTENRYPRLADLKAGAAELAEYVATPMHAGPGEPVAKVFAVDCEMCYTQQGLELTRVTMLSQYGVKLVDMLVLPTNPITDYNTAYSGITAKMLDGVTARLDDARKALFEHGLHSQSILVGHSLENDLRALKLVHEQVIDTALCFPHPEPPYKYGLRKLAETWLGRHIQAGNATGEGHDSAEDASAALQLVQLKLRRGMDFGVPSRDTSSLFQELNEHGRKSTLVHCAPRCRKYSSEPVDIIPADSIAAVLRGTAPLLKRSAAHFVWAHLPSPQSSLPAARAADAGGGGTDQPDLASFAWMGEQDEAVSQLAKQCPPSTLVVVLAMEQKPSSNSDPRSEGTVLVAMTR
jgi:RNA exonuclease 1